MSKACELKKTVIFKFIILTDINAARYIDEQPGIETVASFAEFIPLDNSTQRKIAFKKNVSEMITKLKELRDKL